MPIIHRKPNRLKEYDYSKPWWYFVTICTQDKACWFGEIVNGEMKLNKCGDIAKKCWLEIPKHFPDTELDEYVIMPNHFHGIVIINPQRNGVHIVGNENFRSLQMDREWFGAKSKSLSSIIRGFKIGVTKECKLKDVTQSIWQKSFYDHIIRTEISCVKIRQYIRYNPLRWELDRNIEDKLEL